jgi:hypothetical protein
LKRNAFLSVGQPLYGLCATNGRKGDFVVTEEMGFRAQERMSPIYLSRNMTKCDRWKALFNKRYESEAIMANRKVSLLWHCKTPKGWRRFPVLLAKNGRIRTGYVMESGVERYYPGGSFHLRSYHDRRTVFKPLGKDPRDALCARDRFAKILQAKAMLKGTNAEIIFPS